MKESGLHNVFRIADYGLHIYYNIPRWSARCRCRRPAIRGRWPRMPRASTSYDKGTCPQSDALFARSILVADSLAYSGAPEQAATDAAAASRLEAGRGR